MSSSELLESTSGMVPDAAPPPGLKPYDIELVTMTRREYIELRAQARQYKTMHARAVERVRGIEQRHREEVDRLRAREAELKAQLELARAQLRGLRRRVFGAKAEQAKSLHLPRPAAGPRRPRGQQRGSRGHGRTRLTGLPTRVQEVTADGSCPRCGGALTEMPGTQDAEVLEIEVKAYRRVVRRHRYQPTCNCGCLPGIVLPPPPGQLIPRGKLGVSIWVEVLLSKFLYGQPTHRLLQDWHDQGLDIAQGTLTGGLRALLPLFAPLLDAGRQQLRRGRHWHADETHWEVFEEREGKVGHRWYLWVFKSKQVVHFVLDPSRSATVPATTLAGAGGGVLSVDRYAAYGKFAREKPGVSLAICWAHQRRDFLQLANQHPALWLWAVEWVEQIGTLYALHAKRRQLAVDLRAAAYLDSDRTLRAQVGAMQTRWQAELVAPELADPARGLLRTMQRYWPGLVLFLDHPWLDLDNNAAERALRPAVVGRKNFYGSGSQWSGQLAATMMSLLATAQLWGLNPRVWLTAYLQACAAAGGRPPADDAPFIPWQMTPDRLAAMRRGVPAPVDSS